ncbi:MAG: hypothetical protein JWR26_2300 [Pedosphaera sp.]|nr:hypothetical protein [Pedosphaera sp.]
MTAVRCFPMRTLTLFQAQQNAKNLKTHKFMQTHTPEILNGQETIKNILPVLGATSIGVAGANAVPPRKPGGWFWFRQGESGIQMERRSLMRQGLLPTCMPWGHRAAQPVKNI